MSITTLMSKHPLTIGLDQSLADVKMLFDSQKIHHVLVIENHKLVGVVSDRDLLKNLSPALDTASQTSHDLATLKKRVHQVMTRDLKVLDESADVLDAIHLFNAHQISCIPIVNQKYYPVGIVSWRDILKIMTQAIA